MTDRPPPNRPEGHDAATGRWDDLSDDDQARVKRLLTIDPDDNLADVEARCKRALQIIRGEKA